MQHLCGEQRVTPKGKEVIVDTHPLETEHLPPEPDEYLLDRCAWCRAVCLPSWPTRCRDCQAECLRHMQALQFPQCTARELLHNIDLAWDLKSCQARCGKGANATGERHRVRLQHHRRGELLSELGMRDRKGQSLRHCRIIEEHCSTSCGAIFSPPLLIISLTRPVMNR